MEQIKPHHLVSYSLCNEQGYEVSILNLGARLTRLSVPSVEGGVNVVLGYEDMSDYISDPFYLGAVIGRFTNRITGGSYQLDGLTHQLDVNEGENQLHGGQGGFSQQLWQLVSHTDSELIMSLESPDGDQGFVGTVKVEVIYQLSSNGLLIDYRAWTDKPTPLSLTNHSYFNLNGEHDTIFNHHFDVQSDFMLEVDTKNLPTGTLLNVNNSVFDLSQSQSIRENLTQLPPQLAQAGGYDCCYIFENDKNKLNYVASAISHQSNLRLSLYTNLPAMQFYTGNSLGQPFHPHQAFCFEPQHYLDAPSHKHFPDSICRPNEEYHYQQLFKFNKLT